MPVVELLYHADCPNVPAARERLRRALAESGTPERWTEIDVTAEGAPGRVQGYGSPTILVDGQDVTGVAPTGSSCRVYPGSDVRGVPPLGAVVAALRSASRRMSPGSASSLAVVPGAVLSLLPVVACPPAYAGVLGSLGVPFLMDVSWLLPLTAAALMLAVAGLGHRARARRGWGPLALGVLASVVILLGQFVLDLRPATDSGTAALVAASVWNSWPKRRGRTSDRCGCPPASSS